MPTYEYKCTECGHVLEEFQSMSAEPLRTCPNCKKETLKRGLGGGAATIFKGQGFYLTDYGKAGSDSKRGGKSQNGESKPAPPPKDPPKSDAPKKDSGTSSKPSSPPPPDKKS